MVDIHELRSSLLILVRRSYQAGYDQLKAEQAGKSDQCEDIWSDCYAKKRISNILNSALGIEQKHLNK